MVRSTSTVDRTNATVADGPKDAPVSSVAAPIPDIAAVDDQFLTQLAAAGIGVYSLRSTEPLYRSRSLPHHFG